MFYFELNSGFPPEIFSRGGGGGTKFIAISVVMLFFVFLQSFFWGGGRKVASGVPPSFLPVVESQNFYKYQNKGNRLVTEQTERSDCRCFEYTKNENRR